MLQESAAQSTKQKANIQSKKKKVFISHSSDDKAYGTLLENYLREVGFEDDDIFFSSSSMPLGVHPDERIYERLIEELNNNEVYVIFLLSNSFYQSAACTAEMGAVWLKERGFLNNYRKPVLDNVSDDGGGERGKMDEGKYGIYSIFCIPGFHAGEIQYPLNPTQKVVKWDNVAEWTRKSPLFSGRDISDCQIKNALLKYTAELDSITKFHVESHVTGSAFFCDSYDSSILINHVKQAKQDVFICDDSNIEILSNRDVLTAIGETLKEQPMVEVYLFVCSPDNPVFNDRYISFTALEKVQKLLSSIKCMLEFISVNSALSSRIHLKFNRTEVLPLTVVARDIGFLNSCHAPPNSEIYAVVNLDAEDVGHNPTVKITKKYAKEQFDLYKIYFQNIWDKEEIFPWNAVQVEYDRLMSDYKANLSGGRLLASYRGVSQDILLDSAYFTDYERLFHHDAVFEINTFGYMAQYSKILQIWAKEKRYLTSSEQLVFLFERILLNAMFSSSLKDTAYYEFFTTVTQSPKAEENSRESLLLHVLKTITNYNQKHSVNPGQNVLLTDDIRTAVSLLKDMEKLSIPQESENDRYGLTPIIWIVIRNYLGLALFHTAKAVCSSDFQWKDLRGICGVFPEFTTLFCLLGNNEVANHDIKHVVNLLFKAAEKQFSLILDCLKRPPLHPVCGDVVGAYVSFNLARIYGQQCRFGHNREQMMDAAYYDAFMKRDALSQNDKFPTVLQNYFALEAIHARLEYNAEPCCKCKKGKKRKNEMQQNENKISAGWSALVKHPFADVPLFESVKKRVEERKPKKVLFKHIL